MTSGTPYALFDLIELPVFVLEMDHLNAPVFAALNPCAQTLTQRPLSDYLGQTALAAYPPPFGTTIHARHCEVRDKGIPLTYQMDLPIGDTLRRMRTRLAPKFDTQGNVSHLIGSFEDISPEITQDAQASEIEQFIGLAAHDLRTPMRNIAQITEMLRNDFPDHDDGRNELFDTLDAITVKSMDLIADVLSHVETVKTQSRETAFSFDSLCHDICDTLDPTKKHSITWANANIIADRAAMQTALRNIIDNAIKHGGREILDIRINIRQTDNSQLKVTLTDNGLGFSQDALKVLNLGQLRSKNGYGLFAIRRLISARGGKLIARNLPNDIGAVVQFSLPGNWIKEPAPTQDGRSIQDYKDWKPSSDQPFAA